MRRPLHLVAALALATAACRDGSAPTSPRLPEPAFTFTSGPEAPALHIFRTAEGLFIYLFGDESAGLSATVGLVTPLAQACAAGEGEVVPVHSQFVAPPSSRRHFVDLGRDLPVVVYGTFVGPDLCAAAGAPIVATGTAHLSSTISFAPDGSGKLSQRAQGRVTYTEGGTGRFNALLNLYFPPGGDFTRASGHIRLTP